MKSKNPDKGLYDLPAGYKIIKMDISLLFWGMLIGIILGLGCGVVILDLMVQTMTQNWG